MVSTVSTTTTAGVTTTRVTAARVSTSVTAIAATDLLVGDFRFVAFAVGGVFYNLASAIGQEDVIFAAGDISLT